MVPIMITSEGMGTELHCLAARVQYVAFLFSGSAQLVLVRAGTSAEEGAVQRCDGAPPDVPAAPRCHQVADRRQRHGPHPSEDRDAAGCSGNLSQTQR